MNRRALLAVLMMLAAVAGEADAPPASDPETASAIPFSHAQHAGTHRINCLLCHGQAAREAEANIPSARDCYICHWSIAAEKPSILALEKHVQDGTAIAWPAAVRLPAHVQFPHAPHARQGIDCAACHGDVATMEGEIKLAKPLNMAFCVDCHRAQGATDDCMACHH